MFTRAFWADAIERGIKTFCQTLVAILSAGGVGLLDAPWYAALSAAGMATLLSLLTTIATNTAKPTGDGGFTTQPLLVWLLIILVVLLIFWLLGVRLHVHIN